jgi:replicative DNA helicase
MPTSFAGEFMTAQNEKVDFSKFGKNFQEKLVHIMFRDRLFCDQMREVIDLNFLENAYTRVFVEKMFDYKDKFQSHPSEATVATILRSDLDNENEATQKQVREYFARIVADKEVEDADFVKTTALDFCKKQKLKEAIIKSAKLLQKSASYDEIKNVVDSALRLGSDNNFGYDYEKDFDKRFEHHSRKAISTGWSEIDEITQGGLGRGEMGVVIAGTGGGKSFSLVHIGANAILSGKTVVHYTLELSDVSVGKRYDSCITGIELNELTKNKLKVFDKLKEVVKGKLIIKEYPTRTASVLTLRNHLMKLKNSGNDPDVIIVDYGDLLVTKNGSGQKWIDMETIYEELRGLAQEFQCPIWTASQVNRSASESEVITMDGIASAFSKCFVADFICSMARNSSARNGNSARMYIAKNRNGPDGGIFPMYIDLSRAKLEVLPKATETVDSVREESAKRQADSLKEKYKKFKKSMDMDDDDEE